MSSAMRIKMFGRVLAVGAEGGADVELGASVGSPSVTDSDSADSSAAASSVPSESIAVADWESLEQPAARRARTIRSVRNTLFDRREGDSPERRGQGIPT